MDPLDPNSNVKQCIKKYMISREAERRYASFDYCFNYFQDFRERGCIEALSEPENMQMSCLQLAFYLASWGMLRGSRLLQKSVKFYEPLIVKIAQSNSRAWLVDVNSYSDETIDLLLGVKRELGEVLASDGVDGVSDTDTLVTKIMLGVYGNIPAFDDNFRKGFGVGKVNKKNLKQIARFYQNHKSEIEDCGRVHTLDFRTGKPTGRQYTRAKFVDMVGFINGLDIAESKKKGKQATASVV